MSRDEYLDLVRHQAAGAGGSVGLRRFCRATRLPEKHFVIFGFSSWNAVVVAANLQPSSFLRPRSDANLVTGAFADLAIRLGKWPTENDLSLERKRDVKFPSLPVIRRLGRSGALAAEVSARCTGKPELAGLATVAASKTPPGDPESIPQKPQHIEGYVYMMRSGGRYKIGHTTSPSRRHREVRLDLPDPTDLVHAIPTDDPAGIEAYWHRRFHGKRIRETEFFELERTDVQAFKARKYQ